MAYGNGYRTCSGCREKDVTAKWRSEHGAVLCVACNVDHSRVAADYFVSGTLALAGLPLYTLSPRAAAVLGGAVMKAKKSYQPPTPEELELNRLASNEKAVQRLLSNGKPMEEINAALIELLNAYPKPLGPHHVSPSYDGASVELRTSFSTGVTVYFRFRRNYEGRLTTNDGATAYAPFSLEAEVSTSGTSRGLAASVVLAANLAWANECAARVLMVVGEMGTPYEKFDFTPKEG